ncbi:MAG: DUF2058 family protein [Pseudomonadales bacterium]|nr:DUF2058 family protein [Pseudomonadales bacterium]
MSQSLRDQLVKAGLATSAQAKKAERSNRAEATSERHQTKAKKGKVATPSQSDTAKVKAKAAQQRAERAAKDKALAQQHNEKAQAKALQAQIRQLILQNDQRTKVADDDAVPYNFVHGKKIKKIFVTKQQLEALSSGRLVVVNNNGIYHFVDEKVAKQIEQRDPKRIIVAHDANAKPPEPGSDEEFYAKFEVPDDLDW